MRVAPRMGECRKEEEEEEKGFRRRTTQGLHRQIESSGKLRTLAEEEQKMKPMSDEPLDHVENNSQSTINRDEVVPQTGL